MKLFLEILKSSPHAKEMRRKYEQSLPGGRGVVRAHRERAVGEAGSQLSGEGSRHKKEQRPSISRVYPPDPAKSEEENKAIRQKQIEEQKKSKREAGKGDPIGRLLRRHVSDDPTQRKYIYHGAPLDKKQKIAEEGLKPSQAIRGSKPYVFGTTSGEDAIEYADRSHGIFRFPARRLKDLSDATEQHQRDTGASSTHRVVDKRVPNQYLEVLTPRGFVPARGYKPPKLKKSKGNIMSNNLFKSSQYTPTSRMRSAARLGLELRRKFNRGGTMVGVARARDLANGRSLSASTVKRMHSFFSRHAVDKKADNWGNRSDPSPGYVAWLLWGGDAGASWSRGIAGKLSDTKLEKGNRSDEYLRPDQIKIRRILRNKVADMRQKQAEEKQKKFSALRNKRGVTPEVTEKSFDSSVDSMKHMLIKSNNLEKGIKDKIVGFVTGKKPKKEAPKERTFANFHGAATNLRKLAEHPGFKPGKLGTKLYEMIVDATYSPFPKGHGMRKQAEETKNLVRNKNKSKNQEY